MMIAPAALASWIAQDPTLELPPQMRRTRLSGLGGCCCEGEGKGRFKKSFWKSPADAVEMPSGKTTPTDVRMELGSCAMAFLWTTTYCWKAPVDPGVRWWSSAEGLLAQ